MKYKNLTIINDQNLRIDLPESISWLLHGSSTKKNLVIDMWYRDVAKLLSIPTRTPTIDKFNECKQKMRKIYKESLI